MNKAKTRMIIAILAIITSLFLGYKYYEADARADSREEFAEMTLERWELSMLGLKKYSDCIYAGGDSVDLCLEALDIYEELFPDFQYYVEFVYDEKIDF